MTDDDIQTSAELAETEFLARLQEVHANPDAKEATVPVGVTRGDKSDAQWAYERLILYIKNFEEQLDNEHEAAMGFTGGDAGVMRIEGIGFFDPDIVTFYGSDPSGTKTQMIQHVTQLNVLLRALPKQADHDEPVRIGFKLSQGIEGDTASS